jgi:hypothetical protein
MYFNTTNDYMMVYNLANTTWYQLTNTTSDQNNINTVAGISSDVTATAGKATQIGLLGTADAISDMNVLGTSTNVTNQNTLAGISSDITTVSGISANVTTTAGISSDVTTCATNNANITTTASNISGVNSFAERYRIASSAPASNNDAGDLYFDTTSNELRSYGTSWQSTTPSAENQTNINIVAGELVYEEDLGSIADAVTSTTGNNISDVADDIANVNIVAGINSAISNLSGISSAISTVSGISSNVTSVANNESSVNRYSDEYSISASTPSSPNSGDLWFDSTNSILKYFNGTIWAGIAAGISDVVSDACPTLGGELDADDNNITNCGTVSGANLQIDFGGLT